MIVKIPATNDRYKLVERPRFLLYFENKDWESQFTEHLYSKYFSQEVCNFFTKCILDILMIQVYLYSKGHENLKVYSITLVGYLFVQGLATYGIFRMDHKHVSIAIMIWYISYFLSTIVFIMLGPNYADMFKRETSMLNFFLFFMTAFNCRTWQFR